MASQELMSQIEQEYWRRISAMPPYERVARAASMAKWARETIARQILAEKGEMSPERLRWEVAKRVYIADSRAQATIERELANVPD